jgi:hypothetical protein
MKPGFARKSTTVYARKSALPRRSKRRRVGGYQPTHSLERQQELALEQYDRLSDTLEVRNSDFGVGLFAKEDLPAGFSVHYFGKFYPDSEAVEDANLDNAQYVIAQSSHSHHVDGLAVPVQYAIRANHKPHRLANAELIWDEDYGEFGQPKVELKSNVRAGQEITVDYGQHYDYTVNNFQRGSGHVSPEQLFQEYRDAICSAVGTAETSTGELNKLGHRLMPGFYKGTFARGSAPANDGTRHLLIINQSTGPPGTHWVGCYREPGHEDLIFDTYGRGNMGLFSGRGTDTDVEQHIDDDWCGQGCLAWGLVCKHLGQRAIEI